jgi:hypothetical protein
MFMRTIAISLLLGGALAAAGCGDLNRQTAKLTGWSRACVEGVSYLQFPSGVTAQYDQNGKVVTCK